MAKLFKFLIFIFCLSQHSFAGNLRKMYFSTATYAHSNLSDPAIEGIISIKNTSLYKQRILPATSISLNLYSYTAQGISNTILQTPTMKKVSATGVFTNIGSLSGFILQPQETLLMIYPISPTIASGALKSSNSTFLGKSLLSGNTGNDYGAGDYMGYILFKGSITVDDVSDSGFVNASGAIIKPSSKATLNTSETMNFKINNQVPF